MKTPAASRPPPTDPRPLTPDPSSPLMPTGRPRTLTSEKRSRVELLVSLGWTLKDAAHRVGCAPCTLRREVLRNPSFQAAIETANQNLKVEMLHTIFRAGAKLVDSCRRRKTNDSASGVDPSGPPSCSDAFRAALVPLLAPPALNNQSTSARSHAQNADNQMTIKPPKRSNRQHFLASIVTPKNAAPTNQRAKRIATAHSHKTKDEPRPRTNPPSA